MPLTHSYISTFDFLHGGPYEAISIAFSSSGDLLASVGDGRVRVWNMDGSPRGEPFQAGSYLTSLAFNGAGDVIATADVGGRLRLWKVDGTPKGEVFGGIGVTENLQGSSLHVVSLVDHAPAAKAGIKPGDLIVKIDDTPTQGMSLNDAKSRLRASPVPCFGTI